MKLYIIGAGKYGRVIEDIAEQSGKYESILFLDDHASIAVGKCAEFINYICDQADFFVAFGDNVLRKKWVDAVRQKHARLTTIIHTTAYISPKAKIGAGVVVLPKAIVNTFSVIEDGVIINCGAIVDHDVVICEAAHICVGAIVKADNQIPAAMKVEAGMVIERNTYN